MVSIYMHSLHCVRFRDDPGTIIGINKHNARNVCIRTSALLTCKSEWMCRVLSSISLRLIRHSHATPISAAVADYIHPNKEKKMFPLFFRWIWKIQFPKGNGIYYHFNNSWPWAHVPAWQESRTGSIDVMDARIIALWNSKMELVRAALMTQRTSHW